MASNSLNELNLSRDEIIKFNAAFEDEKFRDLFRQYINKINDPVNRKRYEDEITQLEKQLGHDVVFVNPQASHVIKTNNENTKCYINICASSTITKYTSKDAEQNNVHGINISIPYSVSPLQSRRDKSKNLYNIYTVVFHPDTLKYADEDNSVKNLLHDTAFDAVEKSFNTRLNRINYIIPKKTHKGCLESTIIRRSQLDTGLLTENNRITNTYTEPSHTIVYRDQVDLQNCTNDPFSKLNALVPSHILIDINLPLLNSIQNTKLDINSSRLNLQNDDPVKYKLTVPLTYEVDENSSSAEFNSDTHILRVQIPIKGKSKPNGRCHSKQTNTTSITQISDKLAELKVESTPVESSHLNDTFLRADIKYKVPDYHCNYYHNKLAFVLKVRNVSYDSFKYRIFDDRKGCMMKFSTLGAGHFPMYYSFCVLFVDNALQNEDPLQHLIEDENIFVYLRLRDDNPPLEYLAGADVDNLKKSYLNEPQSIPMQINEKKSDILDVTLQVTELSAEQLVLKISPETDLTSTTNKIKMAPKSAPEQFLNQSYNESELIFEISNDSTPTEINSPIENHSWIVDSTNTKKARRKKRPEKAPERDSFESQKSENEDQDGVFIERSQPIDVQSAYKYADMSKGSILKKNRSFSESSGDELCHYETSRSYSVDDINFSSDSYSQSASKKTVTFNEVISKKLYSSDISIMEQRKRTKRRTQRKDRRASESDNSESESGTSNKTRQELIQFHNESLETSETELTSVSESGETSDDQSDAQEGATKTPHIPCSKKNHKRRGKKSARKNASTAKHHFHGDY